MTKRLGRSALTRRATAILSAGACIVALSAVGTPAAQAASRVDYGGSVPAWATSANDSGTAPADTSVEGEVYLNLRDERGATNLALAVSTPGNSQYRHWLSPQQWISRFSPTKQTYNSVVSYLKAQGLTITGTPASRQYVVFRGSAAQLGDTFGTSLHTYDHEGHQLVAPASTPSLPSSVGTSVSAVSLDQSRTLTKPDSIQQGDIPSTSSPSTPQRQMRAAATPTVNAPCSTYWAQNSATVPAAYGKTSYPTNICGYVPKQLRSAYNLDTWSRVGINGSGQTVAIIDAYASPSILADVNQYSAQNGEPTMTGGQYSQIVPKPSQFADTALCQEPSGWQGEQTLDVEAVHAVAPKAKVLYVGGFDCGGGLDIAMSTILDNKLANIVSNSYGDVGEDVPSDVIAGEQNIHLQAAAEGIGLYFSSGDNGDEAASLGYASPDFPASSPYVTAVGGTSIGIAKNGSLSMEVGWGVQADVITKDDSGNLSYTDPLPGSLFAGGAGGGVSAVNAQPAYQRGIVPNSLAKGKRVSPDLAALADPYTGFEIGIQPIVDDDTLATGSYVNETYGGTSLASPLTAAQIALAQQLTHTTIGFANPTLYGLYRVAPSSFRDVKPPSSEVAVAYTSATSGRSFLMTLNHDTSLNVTKGYDDVTGLGALSFDLAHQVAQGRH
ncbi:S53 family peptidase [Humibacter ginsenosidimutans]|uniref:S8/S53 family peptidase n=1 Tax=Humibacter ginsenosidimutans TaxID=2599293 RepID=A0A5B8M7I4_9MICO|nr:S53 family peptidase [Humibacter ginsenosidimutans]QDZ16149.1 S8/S53 family peptidase [Humibacter ginsenosidimutans]